MPSGAAEGVEDRGDRRPLGAANGRGRAAVAFTGASKARVGGGDSRESMSPGGRRGVGGERVEGIDSEGSAARDRGRRGSGIEGAIEGISGEGVGGVGGEGSMAGLKVSAARGSRFGGSRGSRAGDRGVEGVKGVGVKGSRDRGCRGFGGRRSAERDRGRGGGMGRRPPGPPKSEECRARKPAPSVGVGGWWSSAPSRGAEGSRLAAGVDGRGSKGSRNVDEDYRNRGERVDYIDAWV